MLSFYAVCHLRSHLLVASTDYSHMCLFILSLLYVRTFRACYVTVAHAYCAVCRFAPVWLRLLCVSRRHTHIRGRAVPQCRSTTRLRGGCLTPLTRWTGWPCGSASRSRCTPWSSTPAALARAFSPSPSTTACSVRDQQTHPRDQDGLSDPPRDQDGLSDPPRDQDGLSNPPRDQDGLSDPPRVRDGLQGAFQLLKCSSLSSHMFCHVVPPIAIFRCPTPLNATTLACLAVVTGLVLISYRTDLLIIAWYLSSRDTCFVS